MDFSKLHNQLVSEGFLERMEARVRGAGAGIKQAIGSPNNKQTPQAANLQKRMEVLFGHSVKGFAKDLLKIGMIDNVEEFENRLNKTVREYLKKEGSEDAKAAFSDTVTDEEKAKQDEEKNKKDATDAEEKALQDAQERWHKISLNNARLLKSTKQLRLVADQLSATHKLPIANALSITKRALKSITEM